MGSIENEKSKIKTDFLLYLAEKQKKEKEQNFQKNSGGSITRIMKRIASGVFGICHKEPELGWNKNDLLNYLKEKFVKVEENVEMMGYKGKIVEIYLPEAGGDYNPFKYFISDNPVYRKDFENNPELGKKSYSMAEICGLLGAMNSFMKAFGVKTDENMYYKNDLKFWKKQFIGSYAGNYLKRVAGLHDLYWLRDKDVEGERGALALRSCIGLDCHFTRDRMNNLEAKLILKLS